MAIVKFFKLDAVPLTWEHDAIYYIANGDYAETYITSSAGVAKWGGNSDMINELIDAAIAGIGLNSFYTKIQTDLLLSDKVDKVAGKSLIYDTAITKLNGIATGATANDTDANLRDRTTHTGEQAIDTVTGLQDSLDTKVDIVLGKSLVIDTEIAKLAGVQNGATANSSDADLLDRANHTGEQAISTVTNLQSSLDLKADLVAGKVPSNQLPAYVDDVLEFANLSAFPGTGTSGIIYIAIDTNLTYRWSGSAYTGISSSLALGETSSTAYRGDRGKAAYDHSLLTTGNPHAVTKADVGLSNVPNTDATVAGNITQDSTHRFATDTEKSTWNGKQDSLGFTPVPNTRQINGHALNADVTVSKSDVGLANADNTTDASKPVSTAQAAAIGVVQSDVDTHEANTSNPHSVTKTQVGLGSVDNTTDASKPVSTAQQTAIDLKQNLSANLTALAGLTLVNDNIIQVKSGAIVQRTPAQIKTDLAFVKADVGLGSVDNTADSSKPVSTLQAAADTAVQNAAASDATTKANAAQAAAIAASPAETTTTTGALINSATSKATPVDADYVGLMDSAASNILKKLSWLNIKATLKTYFDTLYGAALGFTAENTANKDATGGYAGLTLFKINFKNALNTFTSFFTNANTAARTYTYQDRNGTIADDTDLAAKQNSLGFTAVPNTRTVNGQALSADIDLRPLSASVSGSNATTASNVAGNITGLSVAVAANKRYRIIATLWIGCDNTGGVTFGLAGPASSAVLSGIMIGSSTSAVAMQGVRLTAMGTQHTVGTAFNRANLATGMVELDGYITTGATTGNITIQYASAVNTQTSTVFIGSTMDLTEMQ